MNRFSFTGILASERATFITPFVKLCVPAEGCSSVHFQRTLGKATADKLLKEGAKIDAQEALRIGEISDLNILLEFNLIPSYISGMAGFVQEVVPHCSLLSRSQTVAENWIREGRTRTIPGGQDVEEYKIVNKRESIQVADSFLSYNFLNAQENFLRSKGKKEAKVFWFLKKSRPLWSRLL